MPAAKNPVVSLKNLTKIFNQGQAGETVALQDVNLDVFPGEFVSLIGPSGCGKSTLLRLVGDLLEPTSGEVWVNGKTAVQARLEHDYGIVFQTPVLYDWRTVSENTQLPLELRNVSRMERLERAREMLALVELAGFADHYPWQLSGGMQQRVAIARALITKPKLLLMDEPFGALDEMTRERMNVKLHRIWRQTNSAVIFVTHSIAEAVYLSNRAAVMTARPGRIMRIIDIDLPPRRDSDTRHDPRFFELVIAVREALREAEGTAVANPVALASPPPTMLALSNVEDKLTVASQVASAVFTFDGHSLDGLATVRANFDCFKPGD